METRPGRRRYPRLRLRPECRDSAREPVATSAARRRPCSTQWRATEGSRDLRPPFPTEAGLLVEAHRDQQRRDAGERAIHPGRGSPVAFAEIGSGQRERHQDHQPQRLGPEARAIAEVPMGTTLRDIIYGIGGGGPSARPHAHVRSGRRAVQRRLPAVDAGHAYRARGCCTSPA